MKTIPSLVAPLYYKITPTSLCNRCLLLNLVLIKVALVNDAIFATNPVSYWSQISYYTCICHIFNSCWRADLSNDLCSSSGQLQYLYCWLCSIGSVRQDCIFLTHEILKLICGRISYCLYCQLCLLNWFETLVFVKHGFGWRTEVYVLLYAE